MSKSYEPTDQELTRWVGTWNTEAEMNAAGYYFDVRTPVPGEVVVVSSHGKFRRGIVTSVGRLRAAVVLTTPTAIEEARKGYQVTAGDGSWTTSHKLTRSQAGGPVRFALVAQSRDLRPDVELTDQPAATSQADTVHPFGSHQQAHREMTPTDRDGELVEVRARGQHEQTQTVRGTIVGQVGGLRNTPGFYVVRHADDGSYQTYDRRVVFQVDEQAQESPQEPASAPATETTGSAVVTVLERVWEAVRANHADLPPVVIVTGSGFIGPARWGHFRANGWTDRDHQETQDGVTVNVRLGEMFVAGETLTKGATHTVETMLHEAAHVLAQVRDIKDTSRQNRWHNQKFRTLAEEVGLEYTKESAHPQAGFSECLMTPGTREEYAPVIDDLDKAIRLHVDLPGFMATTEDGEGSGGEFIHGTKKPRGESAGSATNNLKATCGCAEPRIIRASKKVLDQGFIACGICHESFEVREG